MLDFLKSGKVILNVQPERSYYYPGDTLVATVTVDVDKDTRVGEGKIQLLCREEYEYDYMSTTGTGSRQRSTRRTRWGAYEKELGCQVILQNDVLASATSHSYQFTALIPPDAPASWMGGKIVKLTWLVKASLSRKMAIDCQAESEVSVLTTPPGRYRAEGEYGFSTKPHETDMTLAIPGKEMVIGDTIQGELVLRTHQAIEVGEIKIELVRRECVTNPDFRGGIAQLAAELLAESSDRTRLYEEKQTVKLASSLKFPAGQEARIPFRVTLPSPRPSTGVNPHSAVEWVLRGVLVRGSFDESITVTEHIFVYTHRLAPTPVEPRLLHRADMSIA